MSDHVHRCLSIPPKLSVAYTIGRLKGKSAVRLHRDFIKKRGNTKGYSFWSTGYCASTAGLDEAKVRQYIRHQEETERRQEKLDLDD
jgi:putative transposase